MSERVKLPHTSEYIMRGTSNGWGEYVGELIRCKDCKYWGEDGYRNGCKYATCIMQEQDYCSMAERRTE